ncbi:MAG: metallophosphoesterase family protein [Pseudomonadota bacterium]
MEPTAAPADTAIYAIGDIHGCPDLLDTLHGRILDHAATLGVSRKVAVYLGDYVDRGQDSRGVIDMLIKAPLPDFECVFLKGNHEDAMMRFLTDSSVGPGWMGFGGDTTLLSYGVDCQSPPAAQEDVLGFLQNQFVRNLPTSHRQFLENLVLSHSEGDYFFAHAGVRPGVALDDQRPEDLIWIREAFLESPQAFGKMVVHGHSIRLEPEFRPNRIGIDTGAVFTGVLTCLALWGEERDVLQTG